MGYRIGWVAVKGKPREKVLKELHLKPSGEREEFPESDLVGVRLGNGWYVIVAFLYADEYTNISLSYCCEYLSLWCDVVYCYINETTMMSCVMEYHDGDQVWSVMHNGGEKGVDHIETDGNLPESYESIKDRIIAEQEAASQRGLPVDCVFDLPIDVAAAVTGFRHDRDVETSEALPYEVLRHTWLEHLKTKVRLAWQKRRK